MTSTHSGTRKCRGLIDRRSIVRIGLIEDDADYRRQLTEVLNRQPGWEVVASCSGRDRDVAVMTAADPGIVLLDIELPGLSGVDLVAPLRSKLSHAAIVMLTVVQQTAAIVRAIRAGAAGYILKSDESTLLENLKDLLEGRAPVMSPSIARRLWQLAAHDASPLSREGSGLSQREWDVLRLAAKGSTQAAIGKELGISIHTVKTHMANTYAKLGASSPMGAISRLHGSDSLLPAPSPLPGSAASRRPRMS